jgi:NAD(P)-dependent dehydrogenase (short-subunit alcohol dehydrogenase family)
MTMPSGTVLVTGATSGIGRSISLHLARAGWRVFASGRRPEQLASLVQEASGLALETLPLDVTDRESIRQARAAVLQRTGGKGLDALVNNAGFGLVAPMETIDESDMRRQFETNVFGLVAVSQAFLPDMRANGSGTVVNISSMVGRFVFPLQGIYCATKHAVEAVSDAMRREVAQFGIRVVIVEPGAIRSQFEATATATVAKYGPEGSVWAPALKRWVEMMRGVYRKASGPDCIARAVVRILASRNPGARYVVPRKDGFFVYFMRTLPTRLVDLILRKVLRLG